MKRLLWLLSVLPVIPATALADRDATHYPNEGAYHSTEHIGDYKGNYQGTFALATQVRVDPSFTDGQKGILKDAMEVFMERALKKETIDCAYATSTKDLPKSRDKFEIDLVTALSSFVVDGVKFPAFIFVARFWNDPKAVGIGYLNLFYDKTLALPELGQRSHLHIAINSDFLGYDSRYFFAKYKEYWAGVMGHEFLHNLGYDHPSGYKGSFIEEYGNCLTTNGAKLEAPKEKVGDRKVEKGN